MVLHDFTSTSSDTGAILEEFKFPNLRRFLFCKPYKFDVTFDISKLFQCRHLTTFSIRSSPHLINSKLKCGELKELTTIVFEERYLDDSVQRSIKIVTVSYSPAYRRMLAADRKNGYLRP